MTNKEPNQHETPNTDESASSAVIELKRQAKEGNPLVAEANPEDVAAALCELADERDAMEGNYRRALADLANLQRRMPAREQEVRQAAVKGVLAGFISVIDHFDHALAQNPETSSAEQILDGVKVIRDEFLRVLSNLGVTTIAPSVGDEFEPGKHEAIMQQATTDAEPGRIAATLQVGYALRDWVVRPAKVALAVAPPAAES